MGPPANALGVGIGHLGGAALQQAHQFAPKVGIVDQDGLSTLQLAERVLIAIQCVQE